MFTTAVVTTYESNNSAFNDKPAIVSYAQAQDGSALRDKKKKKTKKQP